jgi:ABC-type Co2+ transport system permease subunit
MPFWLVIIGVPLIVLGIVAIVGGVSALRRRSFGLSLAGAICALPASPLGILAVIFVSLSKGEFEAKKSEAME